MSERNKAMVRRFVEEILNGRNLAAMDELFSLDFDNYDGDSCFSGHEGFKHFLGVLLQTFPDFQVTIEHLIAEGDLVVVHSTVRGTYRSDTVTASEGRKVEFKVIEILRLNEDRIVERWGVAQYLIMLQQLGLHLTR